MTILRTPPQTNFRLLFKKVRVFPTVNRTDRTGWTGQDRTGQDRTGQDRTGQDRTGQDMTDRNGETGMERQDRRDRNGETG